MSASSDLKDIVREKYGQAALKAKTGQSSCCGSAPSSSSCCDPITSNLYDAGQAGEIPDAALKASLGCGNPTALAELKPGRNGSRLGIRWRHRRDPLRAPCWDHGKSLWSRHDRRNARAGRGKQTQERTDQCRISEGGNRAHSAAGQFRGRDHLELRHQPFGRQGPGAAGSVPRAETRWADRRLGCRRARRGAGCDPEEHGTLGRLHRRCAVRRRIPEQVSPSPDSPASRWK